ncbi:MAG: hypothetical protein ACK5X3_05590 [Pseudomonadota bacterium]
MFGWFLPVYRPDRQKPMEWTVEPAPAHLEIERLRRERDEARAKALEEAAAEVDCGCPNRADVLAAESKADLWRACHLGTECNARQAAAIRQLKDRAP